MVLYDWANGGSVGTFFKAWYDFNSRWGGGGGVGAILGNGYGVQ